MASTTSPKKPKKAAGHAGHTQDAGTSALAGAFERPIKVTVIGAGSGFTPRLLNDILRTPGEAGGTLALVDIDRERLDTMVRVIRRLVTELGKGNWTVEASLDRRKVLPGTDYLINTIEVSGVDCVRWDNDIPLKYGIDQCIGDTIGPGGLFKALRTIPVWIGILRDCADLAPQAMVLNYTNPMAMLCTAAARTSPLPVVGLCHSVQGTSRLLAHNAQVPYEEMRWECAGINHLAWFTRLEHKGRDLYPSLKEEFRRQTALAMEDFDAGRVPPECLGAQDMPEKAPPHCWDLVRKDMCVHFGAFITESSGHLSEYLPYYRKSRAGRKLLRAGYEGGSRFYASNWPQWREKADATRRAMVSGEEPVQWERSWEYASWIIEAREKNTPWRFHGNVPNTVGGGGRLITNLPDNACVEVACLVDANGIQPVRYGALPPHMAALCAANLAVFDLGAQAAIERSKEMAIHALMLDPLTAAVCTPAQIEAMALEMFAAEEAFLPGYR
ncbi:MAG: alpha-glucosidase/alpha-galactosidase [Opitutales bacterium]|nr:alpha-glucosidase/alpha-galactosidase [Opitutales bacterium]